jgi:hypothetical protein
VDLGGGEDKNDIGGGFLDGLQQGVEGAVAEHVDFVDDIYFVAPAIGGKKYFILELPDIVDGGVARPVDLDHIEGVPPGYLLTLRAFSAGIGSRTFLAVEGFGEDTGGGGFSNSPGPGKKIGVGDPPKFQRALEGGYDKILTDQLFKTLGSSSRGGYFIGHTRCSLPVLLIRDRNL